MQSKKRLSYTIIFTSILAVILIFFTLNTSNNLLKPLSTYSKNMQSFNKQSDRTLYYMNISFDEKEKKLHGYEVVKYKNKYKTKLNNIVFHLYPDSYNTASTSPVIGQSNTNKLTPEQIGDIEITSVKANNKKLQFTQDNQILKISLNNPLPYDKDTDIIIDFSLKIPNGTNRLGYQEDQYSITNWYPILAKYDENKNTWDETPFYPIGESNYSDCSDYKIDINVPKDMVVVSTGIKTSDKIEKDIKTVSFAEENVRDFVFFMSRKYKMESKEIDGIKVNSYYLNYASSAKRMLNLACEALEFYNNTFGKYPYKEFDIVESFLSGGAMEYPTIIQMGTYPYLNENFDPQKPVFLDEGVVHETGHQWWYSTVGNNEFAEPILDESFTAYSTALFFEKKYGEYNKLGVKSAFLSRKYPNALPIYRATDKLNWSNWAVTVYKLGPIALEDLRQHVGEEKFLEIFREYYDRYKLKNATFKDFLQIVEEKCGAETRKYIENAFTSLDYDYNKMLLKQEDIDRIKRN